MHIVQELRRASFCRKEKGVKVLTGSQKTFERAGDQIFNLIIHLLNKISVDSSAANFKTNKFNLFLKSEQSINNNN